MKNDLQEIFQRSNEIINTLKNGIPLETYDAELVVLDTLISELLTSIGYDTNFYDGIIELKKALRNMYFLGQLSSSKSNKL